MLFGGEKIWEPQWWNQMQEAVGAQFAIHTLGGLSPGAVTPPELNVVVRMLHKLNLDLLSCCKSDLSPFLSILSLLSTWEMLVQHQLSVVRMRYSTWLK